MPYINKKRRQAYAKHVKSINDICIDNPGDLNYLITMLIHHYLDSHIEGYQFINDALGALEGAKLELYRRVVAEYENKKIKDNGDLKD